jgi:hypothetical protein
MFCACGGWSCWILLHISLYNFFSKWETYKKIKLSLTHHVGTRGAGGREEIQLLILDLGSRCGEWSASRSGRALPLEKNPRYPLDRKLGRWQSLSGHWLEEKILCWGSNLDLLNGEYLYFFIYFVSLFIMLIFIELCLLGTYTQVLPRTRH